MILSAKGKKTKINHIDQAKLSDYVGYLNVILFAPEDLTLIKGSPQSRRKFVDIELGQMNARYLYYLAQYKNIVKQKNSYFKQEKMDEVYLEVLNSQLTEFGSFVIFYRREYIKKLTVHARIMLQKITQEKEDLEIFYESTVILDNAQESLEEIHAVFSEQIEKLKNKEIFRKKCLIGPHLDDITFFLNRNNVQTYGSQGQQRSVVLSLKLAEIELIKEETGEYPILLLDDVLSELDSQRQFQLLDIIRQKVQTFLTATDIQAIENHEELNPAIFYIEKGEIRKE